MKHILGLDLGPNSIGWAVIVASSSENGADVLEKVLCSGSRIIPMDAKQLGDFENGNTVSKTKDRTQKRGTRRLYERSKLRRERLHRVLSILGFLPAHYSRQLDRYGKFIAGEPKLPWTEDGQGRPCFLFHDAFDEMLDDFRRNQPDLVAEGRKVPYDWTLYFLRKKALKEKIQKEELAWILLNFNQKRGYYQARGEEEKKTASRSREYFTAQVVSDIVDINRMYKGLKVLTVVLADGTRGKIFKKEIPDWIGQRKDIIVKVDLDKEGNVRLDEDGEPSCRFNIPTEKEWDEQWALIKTKTQKDLDDSEKTVGAYIYDTLLQMPKQKIRGKLVRTIERKYYKDELYRILEAQKEFHPELQDRNLYEACIQNLYPLNDAHRNQISGKNMIYLLVEDILFYQRPLKSKKSLVADCPYEEIVRTDEKTGEVKHYPLKCIPKSHPLFQEFRLWQFISNLRIYRKEDFVNGKKVFDVDVTSEFLKNEDDYVNLFDELNKLKNVNQKDLFKYPSFGLKKNAEKLYRWNYVEDKTYPCNETRYQMLDRLKKAEISSGFLTKDMELALWHILYSVSDREELKKALGTFAGKHGLDEKFSEVFLNIPPFEKDYGAYSCKAIKKLLPLMRMGKYWDASAIDAQTRERISKITSGEYDENIRERVREKAIHLTELSSFRGLPLWLACYVVYDRHSEIKDAGKWERPSDIDNYLTHFKQHSLHNPIVEQVVLETLRTVRDIWRQVGHIDEIHVELGREMKLPKKERERLAKQMQENENANLRIKMLLTEFMNPSFGVEGVRPYSPYQQEKLRIYEETVLNTAKDIDENIVSIRKKLSESNPEKHPTTSEIMRYKCWLEQKYCSPYTGALIPLARLFTSDYEIEHVIPRARYFDDSFSNKVICERAVNGLKDKMLGYEFIKANQGRRVQLGFGKEVSIFTLENYEKFVKDTYASNPVKMKKLLMEDIPEQFIARQLNDSRYISRLIKSLLSNIVREEGEQEDMSKNVIVCTGKVTDQLKRDWGINDVWNEIILPRFVRLNEKLDTTDFTSFNTQNKLIPSVPLELSKGFKKKRIDHRHHAMDAIVIACATRNIVNYLNNESASADEKISRCHLRRLLCEKKKTDSEGNARYLIRKPWETFTQDVSAILQNIVVSFKQNLRVISKTTNYYQHYKDGKKQMIPQEKGDGWVVRKPLHKETFYAEVNLRRQKAVSLKEALKNPKAIVEKDLKKKLMELLSQGLSEKTIRAYFEENKETWQDIDLGKINVYFFTKDTEKRFFSGRVSLDASFTADDIRNKVADTAIQKILLRHLERYNGDSGQAFSPEGIEQMNKNIAELNNGRPHQPILKVRKYEEATGKFPVGIKGNKSSKYVEAEKGTNLFFAVYEAVQENETTGETEKKRSFRTIPLNEVVRRRKEGLPPAPEEENGCRLKFVLSPNDLVYVPTKEELQSGNIMHPLNRSRIYKMVSCTGRQCHFIPACVAYPIIQTKELGSNNKDERAWSSEMIKEICVPIKVDRLGNIMETL